MPAANLHLPDHAPANLSYFSAPVNFSRRTNKPQPSGTAAKSRPNGPGEASVAESRLSELFAGKRAEKAPENFLNDLLAEFRRRNYGTGETHS